MVSGVVDEVRGFGFPMTSEEIERVNQWRTQRYGGSKANLLGSPGVRFLDYGKNKEGYWNYEMFNEQVEDLTDCVECLYPDFQFVMEADWSSGHAKGRSDALNAATMNVNFGGKQQTPHPSVLTKDCLGATPNTNAKGAKLKAGDTQYFHFQDAMETGDGSPDPPPFYRPLLSPAEYVGKSKGMKQALWERGLLVDGMVEKIAEDDLERDQSKSMQHVLSQCEDFRKEVTALQEIFRRRGHILVMTPKGHCELAGEGIEYCWGRMKKYFRKNNRCDMRRFNELILQSMARENLSLRTTRKFIRRARTYKMVYAGGVAREYVDIENMIKQRKSHRNALDFAGKFLSNA
jgi:hypothetical protein